jgi:hypothetical protein
MRLFIRRGSPESPFGSNDEDEAQLHVHLEFLDRFRFRENRVVLNMQLIYEFVMFRKFLEKMKE